MLVEELSNANRIDCNTSIIISSTTAATTTMKRKRDDSCISTSYHQDDDDDDEYILPLHKRYAISSSNRLSAFGMSSYDTESRDGPAASSSTNGNNDSNDDGVLDDETAALVSTFRTSILRGNHQKASVLEEAPHTISPSTTTSLACSPSLYNNDCDADDAEHNDAKGTTTTSSTYPDYPSICRATTISDSSDDSSVESDPIDMSSRPTSPQEEILLEEEHGDYHHDCSDYSPWSSLTELSSLEYTTDRRIEEVVEKDAIEEARERSSSIDRSSSPSSSMVPARKQPSPLWIMSSSSTPTVAQVRGKQEEKTPIWPAIANWNGMFPQGSSQIS